MSQVRAPGLLFAIFLAFTTTAPLGAQSGTSGALAGTVMDSSGAAVTDATVTAVEIDTHATRSSRSDARGRFFFSQVNPGIYEVTVQAPGFGVASSQPAVVGVGRTVTLNFSLHPRSVSQSVEVTSRQELMSLDNPNTATTLEAKTIQSLPNPGQDLTFVAQFAPGALMNTAGSSNDAKAAGGYGNVEFNGLPATSNGYILDGYDTNDPWLGLNIGLSTNLVIGLDAVQEATVNTNSFSVDQGRYGASQVNYFTKSGTNSFHGDMYEIWNGSRFNAQNYFLHANDTPGNIAKKPHSTVNEFGFSIGGPIRKDKLFFFGHYEGIRIALPLVTQITVPSPAYQQYVLSQLATGGVDPITGTALPAQPAEIPFYRNMFSLYRNTGGTPLAISTCPLDASGTMLSAPAGGLLNGAGCANQRQESLTNGDSENLIVVKINHTIHQKDSVWYRFQQDTGLQAAYTDPINPIFNSYSPQPQRTLVACYTHLFSPNLVNQFNPGASWYASIFQPDTYQQVRQIFPIVLMAGSNNAPFTTVGGNDNTYPQGRKVTQWQVNDNLIWAHAEHTLKFGINTRRLDVSNYDLGEGTVPTVVYNDLAQFTYGAAYTASQTFPVALKERVANSIVEFYDMDTYKPMPKATITAGMRVTWNSNETNQQRLFARPAGSFLDMSHATDQPLSQVIQTSLRNVFPATPLFVYQPRVSFADEVMPATVVHAGFGVFSDIIPAQVADLASTNAPYSPTFVGGLGGRVGGVGVAPGVTGSAVDATVNANRSFQTAFASGGAPCIGISPGAPTCPLAVSMNTFPSGTLKTPYYYQYNFGVERQIGSTHGTLRVDYVGTRGVHEPYQVQLNGYQNVCKECFAPYSYQRPLDQRFGSVNEFRTDANSSYSGLQTSLTAQAAGLTLRFYYTLSHCLDEVSNGGLLPFSTAGIAAPLPGELRQLYGDCDYDVRHNISVFGLYQIPFHSRHALLREFLGGWSFSETGFFHTGLPFTVLSQPYTAQICGAICQQGGIFQASGPQFAKKVPGVPLYRKTPYPGVTVAGTKQWLNPDAFLSVVDPTTGACTGGDSVVNCQFGDSGRNTVRGPRFADSDIYLTKRFSIKEGVSLRFDVQMFNAFNHPNFALPGSVEAGVPGVYIPAKFGTLENTISTPTGLLGVGLGGDSSPRMIAFQGRIEF